MIIHMLTHVLGNRIDVAIDSTMFDSYSTLLVSPLREASLMSYPGPGIQ
jgi:hypothetical protein